LFATSWGNFVAAANYQYYFLVDFDGRVDYYFVIYYFIVHVIID